MNLNHFKEALKFKNKWEGGFSNDPDDPGGMTNRGVTQRTYDSWRKKKGLELRPVSELEDSEEILIYFEDYWATAGCSELEYPLNVAVFDTAVNCGVGRATHWLKKSTDVFSYLDLRKNHYLELAKKPWGAKYLKGWLNRLSDLRKLVEIGIEKERAP